MAINDQNPNYDDIRKGMPISSGDLIAHYKIIEKIGAGGMGEVYLAEDTELNRKVALKFLPPHLCQDADCRARFKREAQAAAKLSHPNIITIHEVNEYNSRPYFVMEHIEGESLVDFIKKRDHSIEKIIDLSIQICEGLNKAHQAGIIHRDIKPSNILVDRDGRAKILDFGLAAIKGTDKLTKTGSTLGTLHYMSPEQTRGEEVDRRSDIFSLGAVLYEMITGQLPFKGDHEPAIIYSIGYEEPEPLARYKAGVPDELQRIVSKMLCKDRTARYQHIDDLLADLKGLSTSAVTRQKPRRNVWNRYVVASAMAVVLVIAGYWVVKTYVLPSGGKPELRRKMLAILPFENLGSPDDEYFADGITDEITGKLATIRELGVISRTSTMQYKKTTKNLRQIAKELGVDYILEGSIRWDKGRDTSRVRILPQLIRVSDDTHLWAETYQRPLTDIFATQADIANKIAQAMSITLRESESALFAEVPTQNLEAYQFYLRGMDYLTRTDPTREHGELAIQMFERAVKLDTMFALAYARLSWTHSGMFKDGYDATAERLARAKDAADRALALQPNLTWAHLALSYYYYFGHKDYDRTLEQITSIKAADQNDPDVLQLKAYIWRRQGKMLAAVDLLERVFTLNPKDETVCYGIAGTFFPLRNYASAAKLCDKLITEAPDQIDNYGFKAWIYYAWSGDTSSARTILESIPRQNEDEARFQWFWLYFLERDYPAALKRVEPIPRIPGTMFLDRFITKFQLAGMALSFMNDTSRSRAQYDSARVILENEARKKPDDHRVRSALGIVYAGLGRKDDAIREGKAGTDLLPVSKDALNGPERLEDLAVIYVMVGEYDSALDQIEYLLSIPCHSSVPYLRLDPRYDPLRKLPRYQKLVDKYGT